MPEKLKSLGKQIWNWVIRYPLALLISVGVILIASLIMLSGKECRFNVGGLLGFLFGTKKPDTNLIVNKIPSKRVTPEGKPIPLGEEDVRGKVQHEVIEVEIPSNPFRDKKVLNLPDGTKLPLPIGVLDTDVEKVIQVNPEVFEIEVVQRPKHRVTSDDLKYLGILFLVLLIPSSAFTQDCPEGFKCIPDEVALKWKEILEHSKCMDDALDGENEKLLLHVEPYTIITTQEGQVFSDNNVEMTLTWCDYQILLSAKPNLVAIQKKEDVSDWGFRLRLRLGASLESISSELVLKPNLVIEPFHYKVFHVGAYFSPYSFGTVVGMDITKNADVFLGMGASWKNASIGPVIGISMSFN